MLDECIVFSDAFALFHVCLCVLWELAYTNFVLFNRYSLKNDCFLPFSANFITDALVLLLMRLVRGNWKLSFELARVLDIFSHYLTEIFPPLLLPADSLLITQSLQGYIYICVWGGGGGQE